MNRDRDRGEAWSDRSDRMDRDRMMDDMDRGRDRRESRRYAMDADNDMDEAMGMSSRRSSRMGDRPLHVVCVDEMRESERAMRYALKNLPRDHRLILVHGHYDSRIMGAMRDVPSPEDIRSHYMDMCKEEGMKCEFKHFNYKSNKDFGDKVCLLAQRKGARSVIVGKRDDVTETRRSLMGSGSNSVMSSCPLPVTVVQSMGSRGSRLDYRSDAALVE